MSYTFEFPIRTEILINPARGDNMAGDNLFKFRHGFVPLRGYYKEKTFYQICIPQEAYQLILLYNTMSRKEFKEKHMKMLRKMRSMKSVGVYLKLTECI